MLPAVIWVLVFTIFPLFYSLGLSFYNIVLGMPPQFVGFKNFIGAFDDYKVAHATLVTLIFIAVAIPVELVLGMALALLFNQDIPGRKYFRTILTMPLFFTPVAIGLLGLTIFYEEGGPINSLLGLLGIKIPWLSHPTWAMVAVLLAEIWQWTPFVFLIFLASLQGLPEEIYESALLDSSSWWQIFRWITLPMLQPVIIITLLLRLIEAVKIFDIAYTLTAGGPGIATEVYSLFIYRTGMKFFNLGYASSLAYLLLIGMMIVVTFFFKRMREIYE
ncbi:carbohydrate ABC transporter permease [Candidatus Hakubella thermalkaliphila]|nr:sugar ABC transporter permease [Candidatus Hakubella thermalkaliphila]MBT9168326.1 Lactose transport system permease protein LacF [Bacillota bacterium]